MASGKSAGGTIPSLGNLPVLPRDYPLFDWTASNGSATAAQTRKAYTAASEQGQCADFSRYVWNDI